jgi:ribulose-phosphate 3-epimerase
MTFFELINYNISTENDEMKLIAPSILSADFTRLQDEIKAVEAGGADWIHADVMDGHFVPNITFGPMVVAAVRRVTGLPIDVHLMISEPDRYISDFARAGATFICVHAETCVHLNRTVQLIRDSGVRPGVVLNPATPLDALRWVLEYLDFVLIMGVNPGFGGQAFIPNIIAKIAGLRKMISEKSLQTLIEVDGGVSVKNIAEISAAGADVFVAGSAIFGSPDYRQTILSLRQLANR